MHSKALQAWLWVVPLGVQAEASTPSTRTSWRSSARAASNRAVMVETLLGSAGMEEERATILPPVDPTFLLGVVRKIGKARLHLPSRTRAIVLHREDMEEDTVTSSNSGAAIRITTTSSLSRAGPTMLRNTRSTTRTNMPSKPTNHVHATSNNNRFVPIWTVSLNIPATAEFDFGLGCHVHGNRLTDTHVSYISLHLSMAQTRTKMILTG
jgi:hypothetical protein